MSATCDRLTGVEISRYPWSEKLSDIRLKKYFSVIRSLNSLAFFRGKAAKKASATVCYFGLNNRKFQLPQRLTGVEAEIIALSCQNESG